MFDAKNGKKVFDRIYERVLETDDPARWYEDNYVVWECWKYAGLNAIAALVDSSRINDEDETDLMAYIIECNPDNVADAFDDGFHYLLGNMMQNEYEMGE